MVAPSNALRLQNYVAELACLIDKADGDEEAIFAAGPAQLAALVSHDDWLMPQFAVPDPKHYQQYLLFCDPDKRFSVVSFVWGPGQETPIHNHLTWGMIGMLRGAEISQSYTITDGRLIAGEAHRLNPGEVGLVSPTIGDVHQVRNALVHEVSISIHVYGADIGTVERNTFSPEGVSKPFVSHYANDVRANPWLGA